MLQSSYSADTVNTKCINVCLLDSFLCDCLKLNVPHVCNVSQTLQLLTHKTQLMTPTIFGSNTNIAKKQMS